MSVDKIIKKEGTFKAIVNVNFSIPLFDFSEMVDYNNTQLAKLPKGSDKEIPDTWFYKSVRQGDILTFSDSLKINKITGIVEHYPRVIFDTYKNDMVELPCKTHGNVEDSYNKILESIPYDMADGIIAKKNEICSRFEIKPKLELVA